MLLLLLLRLLLRLLLLQGCICCWRVCGALLT